MCHLSVYSGAAARTHKSRRGGRWARVGAIGPGDPGVRVAQRWVLVGSVRGPRELRGTPRRGRCWRAVFRQNRTQQWRRSHRGCHAARVAHVWPAYGCGSYATSRQSGQDHQEPLCELIPYISEFDRATELKKSERSGKLCKTLREPGTTTIDQSEKSGSAPKRGTAPPLRTQFSCRGRRAPAAAGPGTHPKKQAAAR